MFKSLKSILLMVTIMASSLQESYAFSKQAIEYLVMMATRDGFNELIDSKMYSLIPKIPRSAPRAGWDRACPIFTVNLAESMDVTRQIYHRGCSAEHLVEAEHRNKMLWRVLLEKTNFIPTEHRQAMKMKGGMGTVSYTIDKSAVLIKYKLLMNLTMIFYTLGDLYVTPGSYYYRGADQVHILECMKDDTTIDALIALARHDRSARSMAYLITALWMKFSDTMINERLRTQLTAVLGLQPQQQELRIRSIADVLGYNGIELTSGGGGSYPFSCLQRRAVGSMLVDFTDPVHCLA